MDAPGSSSQLGATAGSESAFQNLGSRPRRGNKRGRENEADSFQERQACTSDFAKRAHSATESASAHAREAVAEEAAVASTSTFESENPTYSLVVKWRTISGAHRCHTLPMAELQQGLQSLEGLHKRLVQRAFTGQQLPSQMTSSDFCRFHTSEECLSMPGSVDHTQFKIIASYDGWEYVVHEESLIGGGPQTDHLHVTVIEFQSIARVIGHIGIQMSMVAYPVISIRKSFLEEVTAKLKANAMKGILS